MRWVIASNDIASNLGVACIFAGLCLMIANFWIRGFLLSGLIFTIVGVAIYILRNKDQTDH